MTGEREEHGGIRNEFWFVCEQGKWNQRLTKQIYEAGTALESQDKDAIEKNGLVDVTMGR